MFTRKPRYSSKNLRSTVQKDFYNTICHKRSAVGFINGGSDGNGCSFYLFETGEQIERGSYFFIVS